MRAPDTAPVASLLDGVDQIDPGRVERGDQAEQHARRDRHAQREDEHAAVDAGAGEPDHVGRRQGGQRAHAPRRQQQARRAGDERQQKAFGNQLADDPAAAGAERRADRHLAGAHAWPCPAAASRCWRRRSAAPRRRRPTGDTSVRRTSPTSTSCRGVTATPRPLLLSGYCCSRRAAIAVSSLCACSSETTSGGAGRRRGNRGAVRLVVARRLVAPDIRPAREVEARRQDADDRARGVAQANRPLKDVRVSAVAALPERVADQRGRPAAAERQFFVRERAADDRLDGEDAKELAIHVGVLSDTPPCRQASPALPRPDRSRSPRTSELWSRQSRKLRRLTRGLFSPVTTFRVVSVTMRSAPGYGSGLSSTPFTTENTAVLAPIPSAMMTMASAAKPGLRRSARAA